MTNSYLFLPIPRRISFGEGIYSLPESALIHLDDAQPQPLRSAADRLTVALSRYTGLSYTYAAGSLPVERVAITLPPGQALERRYVDIDLIGDGVVVDHDRQPAGGHPHLGLPEPAAKHRDPWRPGLPAEHRLLALNWVCGFGDSLDSIPLYPD